MYFKNLTLFRLSVAAMLHLGDMDLDDELRMHPARAPGPLELSTVGFVQPVGVDGVAMTRTINGYKRFTIEIATRLLPASVIAEEVTRRVNRIKEREDRRPGMRERKRIKEEVLNDLLPQSFVQHQRVNAYIAPDGWLVVDSTSTSVSELVVIKLREAVGTLPAMPALAGVPASLLLTDWLSRPENMPAPLQLSADCELHDHDKGKWIGRNIELQSDEVKEHLASGMHVHSLGLHYDARTEFALTADMQFKRLKFGDVVEESLKNETFEEVEAEIDAQFALMTAEHKLLIDLVEKAFEIAPAVDKA